MNKLINSIPFTEHTPESFNDHLKSIVNHTARLRAKKKKQAKERAKFADQFKEKPIPKYYSFRVNKKGTPVLTIRNRNPKYLLLSEWLEIVKEYPLIIDELKEKLVARGIEIKDE